MVNPKQQKRVIVIAKTLFFLQWIKANQLVFTTRFRFKLFMALLCMPIIFLCVKCSIWSQYNTTTGTSSIISLSMSLYSLYLMLSFVVALACMYSSSNSLFLQCVQFGPCGQKFPEKNSDKQFSASGQSAIHDPLNQLLLDCAICSRSAPGGFTSTSMFIPIMLSCCCIYLHRSRQVAVVDSFIVGKPLPLGYPDSASKHNAFCGLYS